MHIVIIQRWMWRMLSVEKVTPMLGTVKSNGHLVGDAANTDLGAAAAYELWDMLSPVKSCADCSEDLTRYEMSLHRFPIAQRQLLAAMEYLRCVEADGHEGYFASSFVFGFEDAVACFSAIGRRDVVDIMCAANQAQAVIGAVTVGGDTIAQNDLGGFDAAMAVANPIADLNRFGRIKQLDFRYW